jgi:hypothetical protein
MLKFEDMKEMKLERPGENVKTMLLYFQRIREYKIWKDFSTADKSFTFVKNNLSENECACFWIELEGYAEIPF